MLYRYHSWVGNVFNHEEGARTQTTAVSRCCCCSHISLKYVTESQVFMNERIEYMHGPHEAVEPVNNTIFGKNKQNQKPTLRFQDYSDRSLVRNTCKSRSSCFGYTYKHNDMIHTNTITSGYTLLCPAGTALLVYLRIQGQNEHQLHNKQEQGCTNK